MTKHFLVVLLIIIASARLVSQSDVNYYYSDTVFEVSHMRFEIKNCMAYREFFKAQLYITNFTDSFKIIDPKNIKLKLSNGNEYSILNKNLFVIAPKGSEKFRLKVEGPNLKAPQIGFSISNVETTGMPVNVYNFGAIELNQNLYSNIKEKAFSHYQLGGMDIYVKHFEYKSNGSMAVKLTVKYTNPNFLGFFLKNIILVDNQGKSYPNKRLSVHYYRKEKKEINIVALYTNPYSTSEDIRNDKLLLENVFVEYIPTRDVGTQTFMLNKKGEGKGNPEKEEKDIEVIED